MNHGRMTLAITAVVAAAALAAVAFTVPQQVMAYRHNHHHNNNHNSIKVEQQTNQENQCTGQPTEWVMSVPPGSSNLCVNEGDNNAYSYQED